MTVWVMLVGDWEWYLWRRRAGAGTNRYRRHVWRGGAEGQGHWAVRIVRGLEEGWWQVARQSGAFGLVDSRLVLRLVLGFCAWSLPWSRYPRTTGGQRGEGTAR